MRSRTSSRHELGLEDGIPKKQTIDAFDNFNDRDSFLVTLSKNATYDFTIKGADSGAGTLEDPILRLFTGRDGLLLTKDDGGQGRDVSLRYVAPETGTFQVSVGSSGDAGTGTYEVGFALATGIDDAATGVNTTSRLELVPNQTRSLEGRLEEVGDIDWHKVNLVANRWYKFSYDSEDEGSLMFIRDLDGTILERTAGESGEFFVRAQQTGDHHLVFRNGFGGYTITGVDNAPPEIAARHGHFRLLGDATINMGSLFDLQDYSPARVQVYAESDFFLDGTQFDRLQLHSIAPEDFDRVQFRGDARRGEYDVSIRAVGSGAVSGWASTVIRSQEDKAALLETGSFWNSSNTQRGSDNIVTYRFADSIPSYFADGRFTGFAEVKDAVKSALGETFGSRPDNATWGTNLSDIVNLQFIEDDSEDADIQIFTADSDQYAVGYKPGVNGFGDIVLDNDFYSASEDDDLRNPFFLSDRETYELNRAVLTALGATHFVPEVNRDESLVGTTFGIDADVYPQSFGYWDVEYLRNTYGDGTPPVNELGGALGVGPDFVRTINNQQFQIFASSASLIDLRPNHTSRLLDETDGKQSYVIGEGVFIYQANGSSESDQIFGHHGDNLLIGRRGDDTIHGLGGDDLLFGGSGNDTYVYETGDGNDLIREDGDASFADGVDTLLLRGKFGVDRLEDDLTFQRLGDDLVVNLSINGNFNTNEGTITIEGMASDRNRIEQLDLRNFQLTDRRD